MRKRRVLALLLALSLVVSGNGMTVLAAEQGADMPVLLSQEETLPEGDNLAGSSDVETSADDDKTETTAPGDEDLEKDEVSGEEKDPAAVEEPEDPVQTEPTAPKGDEAGQEENEKPAEVKPAEDKTLEEADPATTTGEDGTEELPGGDEDNGVQDQETDIDTAEDISGNHVEAPKAVAAMVLSEAQPYVSRIVTFTDDTGMQITYDANAEQKYQYVVDDKGVLTAVTEKTEDVSGNAIDTPVNFSGNVELKQPDKGKQYTSIGSGVFGQNTEITYVKLPAGVETVGKEAFKGCTELKGVYLPAGLEKIEDSAFEGCTRLSQIAVPKTVTQIGDSAFKGDSKLHLVYMKDVSNCDLKSIGAHAFEGCAALAEFCSDTDFILPVKLEEIGEAAFLGCKSIKKLDFSGTQLSETGISAFEGCTGLTDLTPGTNLTLISERAFYGCTSLVAINFVNGKNMTIDRFAFSGCIGLKQLVLPQSVTALKDYAFQNCTRLTSVRVDCYNIEILDHKEVFPSNADGLLISADLDSNAYIYAILNELALAPLPEENKYYKYIVEDVDGSVVKDGKFAGGTISVVRASDGIEEGTDINKLNKNQGVKSGEVCYIVPMQTDNQPKEYTFIESSLRCNGQLVKKVDGKYTFTMPAGGVVITAEFRSNTPDKITGRKVTVEFSDGEPLLNGEQDEQGYLGVELKVGQSTRLFLLDEAGETIPVSKLKISSDKPSVAAVGKNGVIKAAGIGSAVVTVEVTGGDGLPIVVKRQISVVATEVESISLKASKYNEKLVEVTGNPDGIQIASIRKAVSSRKLTFTLTANIYDGFGSIDRELTWTTNNDKVAVVEKTKTEAAEPENEITVQQGTEGEAVITVTANNPIGSEKEKVTQKFVVRVYQAGYKLASSSITINPNLTEGGTMELLSAYGFSLDNVKIVLYEETSMTTTPLFVAKYDEAGSKNTCKKFHILPTVPDKIENGTYNVRVGVNDDITEKSLLPLTITVKRAAPTPTIKFNSKKVKFNLFYKDGRASADSEPTLVTTEITKLGTAKIKDVKLEPLSNSADDKLFTENFVVDEANSNYAEGKVIIRRSGNNNGNLQYTSKKAPAVKGRLVIYYEGYEDFAAKKMDVTMPTCTTAPSYALRETKGTYSKDCLRQDETFELYDKKSKTKERIVLGADHGDAIAMDEAGTDIAYAPEGPIIQPDGTVKLLFSPYKGKLKFVLKNQNWDLDKNHNERMLSYTYTVSIGSADPTIKTKQSAVSLNLNYPEQTADFELVSNQKGVTVSSSQDFEPVITKSNESEIGKLDVKYTNGKGTVAIKGQTVKKGTYKFECYPPRTEDYYSGTIKKVTLTVKVVDSKPTIKFGKGSLQLNRNAPAAGGEENVEDRETAEISFKASGIPAGYTLAEKLGTGQSDTEIKCTSHSGKEAYFNFRVSEGNQEENTDDMLKVSLKDRSLPKGTYTFSMTARYFKEGVTTVSAKPVKFKVKVTDAAISLTVAAKGQINLLNREGEASDKNGIIYTPTLKNLTGQITEVKIYDATSVDKESANFDIELIEEGKDAGKFFVKPKITLKDIYSPTPENPPNASNTTTLEPVLEGEGTPTSENPAEEEDLPISENQTESGGNLAEPEETPAPETPAKPGGTPMPENPSGSGETTAPNVSQEYEYADLNYNKDYSVRIWVKVKGYAGTNNGGIFTNVIKIKTKQTLPKVTVDKTALDVYLSTKDYDASFVVKPKEGSVGKIERIEFGEGDEKARESFTLIQTPQADGSMKVTVHLQEAVEFANDSYNDVQLYVKYKGQGANTPKNATSFTMKIHVN